MTIGFNLEGHDGEHSEGQKQNQVNHPGHYLSPRGMEAIDVIEDFGLGFHLGNAVKYILRAGKKDEYTQELEKAVWYLEREIERVNNA